MEYLFYILGHRSKMASLSFMHIGPCNRKRIKLDQIVFHALFYVDDMPTCSTFWSLLWFSSKLLISIYNFLITTWTYFPLLTIFRIWSWFFLFDQFGSNPSLENEILWLPIHFLDELARLLLACFRSFHGLPYI